MFDDSWPDDDLSPDSVPVRRDDAEDLFPLDSVRTRRWSAFSALDGFLKVALFLPLVSVLVADRGSSWPTMWVCAVMASVVAVVFATGESRSWAGVVVAALSAAAVQIPGRPVVGVVAVAVALVASLVLAWRMERR